jgi:hypothetical protein
MFLPKIHPYMRWSQIQEWDIAEVWLCLPFSLFPSFFGLVSISSRSLSLNSLSHVQCQSQRWFLDYSFEVLNIWLCDVVAHKKWVKLSLPLKVNLSLKPWELYFTEKRQICELPRLVVLQYFYDFWTSNKQITEHDECKLINLLNFRCKGLPHHQQKLKKKTLFLITSIGLNCTHYGYVSWIFCEEKFNFSSILVKGFEFSSVNGAREFGGGGWLLSHWGEENKRWRE